MLDPVVKTIEVPCSQRQAFEVFVSEINVWWPVDKRSVSAIKGQVPKSVTIDPRPGGKVVEVGPDDVEHLWGTVRTYDPHALFSMDFHMARPATNPASLVEVRFSPVADSRTRVVLTQSNWEAFGDAAEAMRGGYGSSWGMIFEEGFKAACGG